MIFFAGNFFCLEQRGEDNSAQAGPIAAAIAVLAKEQAENLISARAEFKHGGDRHQLDIGAPSIAKLLGYPRDSSVVVMQIANLKVSGDEVEQRGGTGCVTRHSRSR